MTLLPDFSQRASKRKPARSCPGRGRPCFSAQRRHEWPPERPAARSSAGCADSSMSRVRSPCLRRSDSRSSCMERTRAATPCVASSQTVDPRRCKEGDRERCRRRRRKSCLDAEVISGEAACSPSHARHAHQHRPGLGRGRRPDTVEVAARVIPQDIGRPVAVEAAHHVPRRAVGPALVRTSPLAMARPLHGCAGEGDFSAHSPALRGVDPNQNKRFEPTCTTMRQRRPQRGKGRSIAGRKSSGLT